jgi:hypothetical protein
VKREHDGIGSEPPEWLILTATRTTETLLADWTEIDLQAIDQLTKPLVLEDGDFPELKWRQASARTASAILSAGKAGAYEAALAELDESTLRDWEFRAPQSRRM